MRKIGKKIGMTGANLYNYYSNKDENQYRHPTSRRKTAVFIHWRRLMKADRQYLKNCG